MSTEYDDEPEHDDGDDGWQEHKDNQLMGEPREEPEEEPPMDLEAVSAAWERIRDVIRELGDDGAIVAQAVPELVVEAREAREAFEQLREAGRREYTVTTDVATYPAEDAELVTQEQADAVLANGSTPRALWTREVMAWGWIRQSREAPF